MRIVSRSVERFFGGICWDWGGLGCDVEVLEFRFWDVGGFLFWR